MTVVADSRAAAAPDDEGEISTFGWDTAFAVRIENVNAAIKARKASPASFQYIDPSDSGIKCAGQFGDWEVVRGGDGGGVNVMLPVHNVTGHAKENSSYVPYTWAGGSMTFTIRLEFFDAVVTTKHLKVKGTSDDPDNPVVEYYDGALTAPANPAWAIYAIQAALTGWCMENLADFAYVFSIVDINDEADKGAWSFLKPTTVSYSYVDGLTDADAFLGVLAMTNGRPAGGLQQVIDTRIVQNDEEGAFCISRQLLLVDLIAPNLIKLWPNLTLDDLVFGEQSLELKPNIAVDLPQVTDDQGNPYTPQLKEFTFSIEGAQISIDAYTETEVQAGVTAWCRTTSYYTITKGTNKSGQTTLAYAQIGTPDQTHGHIVAEWVKITDAIMALILAIALAVLAVVTGGAAVPVIAILGALLVGLVAFSGEIAGLIANDDAPAIDLLAENIYAPMVWTDSRDFTVVSVDLDGSIRLGGSLGFGRGGARAAIA